MATKQVKPNHVVLKRILIGLSVACNVLFLVIAFAIKSGYMDYAIVNYVFGTYYSNYYDQSGNIVENVSCFSGGNGVSGLAHDKSGHLIYNGKVYCIKGFTADPE
jgi:hypothetical protein